MTLVELEDYAKEGIRALVDKRQLDEYQGACAMEELESLMDVFKTLVKALRRTK